MTILFLQNDTGQLPAGYYYYKIINPKDFAVCGIISTAIIFYNYIDFKSNHFIITTLHIIFKEILF